MAPNSRIYLTRHAQAEHNVDLDYSIHDAPLTALGRKQAASLAPKIPKLQEQVQLVVSSPLKRTLETTLLGWGPAVQRLGVGNVICLPEAQECNGFPCDTGSDRSILERDPQFAGLNFSRLTPEWTSKTGFWAPDPHSIAARARSVRQFLREQPEAEIVLVAHGDILRQITADTRGPSDYGWKNAEVRVFTFDPASVDSNDCFLKFQSKVEAAGGHAPTSTAIELENDGDANGKL